MKNIRKLFNDKWSSQDIEIFFSSGSIVKNFNLEYIIKKAVELNNIPGLKVYFTPCDDTRINKLLLLNNLEKIEYVLENDIICYKTKKYERLICHNNGNYFDLAFRNTNILKIEVLISNLESSFLIVSDEDWYNSNLLLDSSIRTFDEALRILRIFFRYKRKELLVNNFSSLGEYSYDIIYFKSEFPLFQYAWEFACSNLSNNIERDKVFIQLDGFGRRLQFLCKALDNFLFNSLQEANNYSFNEALYHYTYSILLTTGTFDDISWILNYIYSLNLEDSKIDIALPRYKYEKSGYIVKYKKLVDKLKYLNPNLHNFLMKASTLSVISLPYPLRDKIMHREFNSGYTFQSGNEKLNRIKINSQITNCLEENAIDLIRWGYDINDSSINILLFGYEYWLLYKKFINEILDLIDWSIYYSKFPKDKNFFKGSLYRQVFIDNFTKLGSMPYF